MSKAGKIGIALVGVALVYFYLVRSANASAAGINIGVEFPLIDMKTGMYKNQVNLGGGGAW